jgi:hypothetical protein
MNNVLSGRSRGRRSYLLIAAAAAVWSARAALGQDYWIADDGNWSNPNDWFAGNVPGNGDSAAISESDGVDRTVTYDYTGPTVTLSNLTLDLTNAAGTSSAVLSMSANALSANLEYVGLSGSGTFNQSGGVNAPANLNLGNNAGSTGTYVLSGGTLSFVSSEQVGVNGTGNFNQNGNGANDCVGLILGANPGSTGTYTLSGSGELMAETGEAVGAGGVGNFNQSGGVNSVANSLYIASEPGSTGSYTLTGGTLSVGGELAVAFDAGSTGTLTVSNTGYLSVQGTLLVGAGGTVNLNVPSTSIGSLPNTYSGQGIINVNGALTINHVSTGPTFNVLAAIVSALRSGYDGGTWSGTAGIVSTVAAASTKPLLSLGYADGSVDTGTPATSGQVLIMLTLAGDANLDGTVNFDDLDIVGRHLNTSGNDWSEGNFTYDPNGAVNFNDLDAIGQNLNKSIDGSGIEDGGTMVPLGEAAEVQNVIVLPEPGGIMLLAAGGLLVRRRRRAGIAGATGG